jgi:Tol biopolymer transport system component/DNA-binding winged helix-turn-helix (wHTH) protein
MTGISESRKRFGPFTADVNTRELWKNGVRVKLGGQPFEILAALLERPGSLVSREELRKRVWPEDTFVDFGHGLNAAVRKLREALCDSAEEPRYIETLPRRGYRFIARIEATEQEPVPVPATPPPLVAVAPEWKGSLIGDEWDTSVPVKRNTLIHVWALLALVLCAAVLSTKLWFDWQNSRTAETAEQTSKQAAERSAQRAPSIWRLDMTHAADPDFRTRILTGPEAIGGPQPSPDGKKLAYMAGRTESAEIWVSTLEGAFPRRLTSMGKTGTPRWSPDSRSIAFDSDGRENRSGIYVVPSEGGSVRPVVEDRWNNSVPSWSRDGKWIYFASNRDSGDEKSQVWKVSVDGGQLVQVTHNGGFSAYESPDGQTLYYAKSRYENPELWQVPVNGGTEARVSSLLHPSTWANWAVTDKGIFFLSEYSEKTSTLEYFDFASRGVHPVATLEKASFWLSASVDGSSIWYSELTEEQARGVFRASMD